MYVSCVCGGPTGRKLYRFTMEQQRKNDEKGIHQVTVWDRIEQFMCESDKTVAVVGGVDARGPRTIDNRVALDINPVMCVPPSFLDLRQSPSNA